MVDHLEVPAELGVFVPDRVEAVRTMGDDLRKRYCFMASTFSGARSGRGIPRPSRRATSAWQRSSGHDGEAHPRRLQDASPPSARWPGCACRRTPSSRPSTGTRPPCPPRGSARPGLPPRPGARPPAVPTGCPPAGCSGGTEAPLTASAPSERARKRRRSTMVSTISMKAGHSCTQAMHVVHAHSSSGLISSPWMGPGSSPCRCRLSLTMICFGRERRAGQIGRTGVLATPALQAGVEVEPPLPRELLQLRDAEAYSAASSMFGMGRWRPAAPAWRRRC